jgi:hypothetical protein
LRREDSRIEQRNKRNELREQMKLAKFEMKERRRELLEQQSRIRKEQRERLREKREARKKMVRKRAKHDAIDNVSEKQREKHAQDQRELDLLLEAQKQLAIDQQAILEHHKDENELRIFEDKKKLKELRDKIKREQREKLRELREKKLHFEEEIKHNYYDEQFMDKKRRRRKDRIDNAKIISNQEHDNKKDGFAIPVINNDGDVEELEQFYEDQDLKDYNELTGQLRNYILFGELPNNNLNISDNVLKSKMIIRKYLGLTEPNQAEKNMDKVFKIIDSLNTQTVFVYNPEEEYFSIDTNKRVPNDQKDEEGVFCYFNTEARD